MNVTALAVTGPAAPGYASRAEQVPAASVAMSRVSKAFGGGPNVLEDLTFSLAEQEFVAIVGPSGCGKSTILKLICGLIAPTHGEIKFRGALVDGHTPAGVGFMFQRDTLLPWLTVVQNIAVGLDCRGVPKAEQSERIAALLRLLSLGGFGDYYPRALSGGMRQRVALGRLLAYEPDVYLMDEPFGALDAQTKMQMGYELLAIWSQYRKGVIFVTHDIEEAVSLADRVIVMTGRPGRIKSQYRIDLARPRDLRALRRVPEFHTLVDQVWHDVLTEHERPPAKGEQSQLVEAGASVS
jgi:NitT/TauT family transport system ATP-binding protein